MLSEKGSLKDTPVLKLLLTVFEQGLTGILYLKNEDNLKVIYFNRGKLIWAISNSEDDKLENILMAKGLVDLETVKKLKREARVTEMIGKLLVQKGLITLEELIESSRTQLKRIINSTLKWKNGGFQFVKDSPPGRLLSLDENITRFIYEYIIEEVDLGEIWKTIGSLQIELIKIPDEQKIAKYQLTNQQREILNSFDGENKLEGILSRYSSGHRESLLKVIYYFLMAELLIKKEFELSDLSGFEEENQALDIPAMPSAEGPFETPAPVVKPNPVSKVTKDDYAYALRESGEWTSDIRPGVPTDADGRGYRFGEEPALEKELKSYTRGSSPRPTTRVPFSEVIEEKKRGKLLNYVLLSVFLILIMGGVILLLIPWLSDEQTIEEALKKDTNRDIIQIEEKTAATSLSQEETGKKDPANEPDIPATPKQDNPQQPTTTNDEKKSPTSTENTSATKNEPPTDTPPNSKTTTGSPDTKETQTTPKDNDTGETKEPKVEPKPQDPPGKSAFSYFQQKNMITAADVWRRELLKEGVKYSILIEMDCQKESVLHAYNQLTDKSKFFLLNRESAGKSCFLVMWGKFYSYDDAKNALNKVPAYFWKQKDPPEVVELPAYL